MVRSRISKGTKESVETNRFQGRSAEVKFHRVDLDCVRAFAIAATIDEAAYRCPVAIVGQFEPPCCDRVNGAKWCEVDIDLGDTRNLQKSSSAARGELA